MRGMKDQTFLTPKDVQEKQELGAGTYDAECAREELAKTIIMHEYPLSIVDHLDFRRWKSRININRLEGSRVSPKAKVIHNW